MARKPRIYFPGAVYHVMLRGNAGMKIFFCEDDRKYFYYLISEGIKKYRHEMHGFCLMSNHVHLVIRVGTVSLSKIIQNLSFRYTRWINKRERRIGHLFQGRYKAILVDEENQSNIFVRMLQLAKSLINCRIIQ
jgi:putative transposase